MSQAASQNYLALSLVPLTLTAAHYQPRSGLNSVLFPSPGEQGPPQADNLTESIYLGEALSPGVTYRSTGDSFATARLNLHLSAGGNSQKHPWSPVHKLQAVPQKAFSSVEQLFAAFIALGSGSVNLLTL